jgi:predicted TIM-barrel fold metal-dependent hydrolase
MMSRAMPFLLAAVFVTFADAPRSQAPRFPSHPDFKPTPEVPPMPKALMKFPRTSITRAQFPAIDFHFHGRGLKAADDYRKMIKIMDDTGIGMICNMDGGFGTEFDRTMKAGEPFRDRIVHFARIDFDGINEPGWSAKTAAELERDFLAGAAGLKINKVLGLDLRNPDGTYIQVDDPRFDPVWAMCAKHSKPVMIHISDSYGRFLPIGPDNERYEAGLWRTSPEGSRHRT